MIKDAFSMTGSGLARLMIAAMRISLRHVVFKMSRKIAIMW
jgi:hypothetical protein